MKKLITLVLTLIFVLALAGCGQHKEHKSFEIENAHKIVVISVDGQRVEITDTDAIQKITENIVSIQFEKEESSKNTDGFGPIIQWYDSNNDVIEVISITGEKSIIYNNYFWTATDGNIDITALNELLK